jgi:uncharacterized membrane protein YfcA
LPSRKIYPAHTRTLATTLHFSRTCCSIALAFDQLKEGKVIGCWPARGVSRSPHELDLGERPSRVESSATATCSPSSATRYAQFCRPRGRVHGSPARPCLASGSGCSGTGSSATWGRACGTPSGPSHSSSPPLSGPARPSLRVRAAVVGLASGALGACAGIGGGIFIVPALVRTCGLAQPAAAATSMAAVCAVSGTSAISYARAEGVRWDSAALLAVAAALATPFGASVAHRIDPRKLRLIYGGFLVLLAPVMPLRPYLMPQKPQDGTVTATAFAEPSRPPLPTIAAGREPATDSPVLQVEDSEVSVSALSATRQWLVGLSGAGIGFGAGLLGVGGGSLMTPLIACVHPELPLTVRFHNLM